MQIVKVSGDCDLEYSMRISLDEQLKDVDEIMFDLSACKYISSTFIGFMLNRSREIDVTVLASEYVYNILNRMGLVDVLNVYGIN